MDEANVFSRLFRCARGNYENFLTEALCVVLTQLAIDAPSVAVKLLSLLTDGLIASETEIAQLHVSTQERTLSGTPDIAVRCRQKLVYIEVKDESSLGHRQLERYRGELDVSGVVEKRLIFLGRYGSEETDDCTHCDKFIRWFDVACLLESELEAASQVPERTSFLSSQFIDFLSERGLALGKVRSELAVGLQSLISLRQMLEEAAVECGFQPKWTIYWDYQWFGCRLDDGRYTIAMNADWPHHLVFRTGKGFSVDPTFANFETNRWMDTLDLSANDGEFYRASKTKQLASVVAFLRKSVEAAKPHMLLGGMDSTDAGA